MAVNGGSNVITSIPSYVETPKERECVPPGDVLSTIPKVRGSMIPTLNIIPMIPTLNAIPTLNTQITPSVLLDRIQDTENNILPELMTGTETSTIPLTTKYPQTVHPIQKTMDWRNSTNASTP